ncbi:MAG: hypothetical protein E6R08_10270 [Nevskiaceae bacterium]|nr:MAG: hypothetical protein E6R08_10270 [Nevskiaceae bacterium]
MSAESEAANALRQPVMLRRARFRAAREGLPDLRIDVTVWTLSNPAAEIVVSCEYPGDGVKQELERFESRVPMQVYTRFSQALAAAFGRAVLAEEYVAPSRDDPSGLFTG